MTELKRSLRLTDGLLRGGRTIGRLLRLGLPIGGILGLDALKLMRSFDVRLRLGKFVPKFALQFDVAWRCAPG